MFQKKIILKSFFGQLRLLSVSKASPEKQQNGGRVHSPNDGYMKLERCILRDRDREIEEV